MIKNVYVVIDPRGFEPLGVFLDKKMADDFKKYEYPDCEVQMRKGFLWDEYTVSIFDPRISFKWELGTYSAKVARNQIRVNALAKLTPEEKEVLGVR
jgi:hypothetical protein